MPNSEHQSWHDRWQEGRIGFHQEATHTALVKYWPQLLNMCGDNPTVFVPLCGKSRDMLWLAQHGAKVVGIDLSPIAVQGFFKENVLSYTNTDTHGLETYTDENYTLYTGDFFAMRPDHLSGASLVYDRAALIALPPDLRQKYATHLRTLLSAGRHILLITLVYNQTKMQGPPFSVPQKEVQTLFGDWCKIVLLEASPPEPFADTQTTEMVYKLTINS